MGDGTEKKPAKSAPALYKLNFPPSKRRLSKRRVPKKGKNFPPQHPKCSNPEEQARNFYEEKWLAELFKQN